MSIRLMSAVWDLDGLPGPLTLVLLRLADHANDDGRCHPGQESLSVKCRQSERTVRHNLDTLKRLGLVEVVARRRRASQEYQLHLPDPGVTVDWPAVIDETRRNLEWVAVPGWFNQDRQPVAALNGVGEEGDASGQDRQPIAANTGQDRQPVAGQPESRPATTRNQDRQPSVGKTGNLLPVSKGNHQEPSENHSEAHTDPVEPPPTPAMADMATNRAVRDTLTELFFPAGVTTSGPRLGRVVRTLIAAGATSDQIRSRYAAWPRLWPTSGSRRPPTVTLEALTKWWDELGVVDTPPGAANVCDLCRGRGLVARLTDGRHTSLTDPALDVDDWTGPFVCPECRAA